MKLPVPATPPLFAAVDGQITGEYTPGCEWVGGGEGVATFPVDGHPVRVGHGWYDGPQLWVELLLPSPGSDTWQWVPYGRGPAGLVAHLEEALGRVDTAGRGQPTVDGWAEGLYELTGPSVGTNPETYIHHVLVPVDVIAFPAPTDLEGLRQFDWRRHPAVVWHHPDGRRARLSAADLTIRPD